MPEVLEDTYLIMELSLPHDVTGPYFSKVTKQFCNANGIPISTSNYNPIIDTIVYDFEYMDGHRV